MLTTSNTQYNSQRLKTVAAVQTFKKQYSFKACIAAVADPGEGPGGGGVLGPPYVSTTMRPEGPKKKILDTAPAPIHCSNGGSRGGAGGPAPPLFFDPLISGSDDHPPPPPSLKVWIRHCAITSARRKPRRDSEFCKRLKGEKLNGSQKVCLNVSE